MKERLFNQKIVDKLLTASLLHLQFKLTLSHVSYRSHGKNFSHLLLLQPPRSLTVSHQYACLPATDLKADMQPLILSGKTIIITTWFDSSTQTNSSLLSSSKWIISVNNHLF